jgi:hypothetical protein
VTNKNKKRPSGYRTPPQSEPQQAPRKGLLDGLFAPRVSGSTSMPKITASLRRGAVTVTSSPLLVVSVVSVVALEWIALVAFGAQGPFALTVNELGVPPVGTYTDLTLSIGVFGVKAGFLALLGFVAVRAVILAAVTSMAVDVIRTGSADRWSFVRAVRLLPVTAAVNIACLGILIAANFIGPLLGAGFGLLILMASLVLGVYLLGFAPAIAATEPRGMADTLGRAVRAGRLPGAGNLTFAAVYVLTSIAVLAVPKPGSLIGVNPAIGAWAIAMFAGLAHAVVVATLVFRYLSIADEVAEPAAKGARRGRSRRG